MEEKSLKEKVDATKEAVKDLEEPLKSRAFEIILNKLLAEDSAPKNTSNHKTILSKSFEEDVADKLINTIDSSAYPLMFKLSKALDLSLYTLYIAKNDNHVDGLTPQQISKILSLKFRIPCTFNNVGMALMKVPNLADRKQITTKGASAYEYRITYPGEQHIKTLLDNPPEQDKTILRRKSINKTQKNSKRTSKQGLKERIIKLKEENFFDKPKETSEVKKELANRGFHYGPVPVNVALLRLVRKSVLRRIKEAKEQKSIYKYCNP